MMHSIRSDVEPVDPSVVPIVVSILDRSLHFEVAIASLLVYDTIIAMDKEVRYFWNSPGSFVSLVYFSNRYIGVFSALVNIPFFTLHVNENFTDLISILLIDYILLMRVLALYEKKRTVVVCLRILFVLEGASMAGILLYTNIYEGVSVGGLAIDATACGVNRTIPQLWSPLFWSAPLVYGSILMILAIYKASKFWRLSAGFSNFSVVKILIEDQAVYFFVVLLCSVANIVADSPHVVLLNYAVIIVLNILSSTSLLCILGSRLLVHLKEAGERGFNEGTSYRTAVAMSDIAFS
ncbi:hypothetical protein M0805_001054 [Coniferiporia weirii]|nr:hypothetical protein M0805_001054 [Coniferiporia weirii]